MIFQLPCELRSIIWTQTEDSHVRFKYDNVLREIQKVGKYILDLMDSEAEYEKQAYIGPTLLQATQPHQKACTKK